MRHLECRTLAVDAYPAGLHLACDLWTAAKQTRGCPLVFTAIEQFWDGVKLVGAVDRPLSAIGRLWNRIKLIGAGKQRPFAVEINYATEEIVMLSVDVPRRRFEGKDRHNALVEEVAAAVEAVLETIDGRLPVP